MIPPIHGQNKRLHKLYKYDASYTHYASLLEGIYTCYICYIVQGMDLILFPWLFTVAPCNGTHSWHHFGLGGRTVSDSCLSVPGHLEALSSRTMTLE